MRLLTIKYKLVCLAVACCAIFTACEQADLATKSPMTFKNGQVRAIAAADANARVFAYRVTEGNATPEWLYGTAAKGANAQLTNIDFTDKKATFAVDGETKYWTNATYNFFSLYSKTLTATGSSEPQFDATTKTFTFPYTIADVTNSNNELWAASKLNEVHEASESTPVKFEFNHILSKINFKIKKHTANTNNKIVVTKVTISDVYTSGVYNLAVESSSATWTFADNTTKPIIEFNNLTRDIEIAGTPILTHDLNGFLVIPQIVGANKKEIVIDYSYYQAKSDDTPEYTKQVKAFLPISSVTNWEVGKNYVYNLILSADVNDIYFTTPTISDWGTSSVGSIIIQ